MGILEFGLTVWAWKRGWKTWALLPLGIGFSLAIFVALVLHDAGAFNIAAPRVLGFIVIDVAVIVSLILMVLKKIEPDVIKSYSRQLSSSIPALKYEMLPEIKQIAIRSATITLPAARAKLVIQNKKDIAITGIINPIGRDDFEGVISSATLKYISRQHCWIRFDGGNYFLEDCHSVNGTKLNGIDIRGKGLHLLNDGDRIDLAEILVLTFRSLL